MKQRYIKVNHELIPVTDEIYHAANQMKEKERYRARRDGKCGQPDYRYCTGDCATCRWQQEGYRMLSISRCSETIWNTKHPNSRMLSLRLMRLLPTDCFWRISIADWMR